MLKNNSLPDHFMGKLELVKEVMVKEMTKGTMANVVQQRGHPNQFF